MEPRFTPQQLNQLIAEVEQLSQAQRDQLTADDVKRILEELNLPTQLLDQAILQCQRRQALAHDRRRQRWLVGGLAAASTAVLAGMFWLNLRDQKVLEDLAAQRSRVVPMESRAGQPGRPRQLPQEIRFEVTLQKAPLGRRLPLTCQWSDPRGEVFRQNHYLTREITSSLWMTHCRLPVDASLPTGTWTVRMEIERRVLAQQSFTLP